jgi:hypothetical protein
MIGMIRSSREHDSKNIENCLKRPFTNEDRFHHADITWLGFNCLELHSLRNDCPRPGLDLTGRQVWPTPPTMLAIIDDTYRMAQGRVYMSV